MYLRYLDFYFYPSYWLTGHTGTTFYPDTL